MSFHLYQINELYSNADGSIQFIELAVGNASGESFWQGQTISVRQGSETHSYVFPANLPSTATANTTVLITTPGFASLGLVTPNYVVPAGFLFTQGGTLNFANADTITYGPLPGDGNQSLSRSGATQPASPKNFQGTTATLPESKPPIVGTAGNDNLLGSAGNDTINGNAGIDTVTYASPWSNYSIARIASGVTVAANAGTDGTDSLQNIERLQFSDRKIALDLETNGNAGQAMSLIGVLAPALLDNTTIRGAIISLFDQGQTMESLCQLALNLDLIPRATNAQLATAVFSNVTGGATASAELTNALVSYIDSHSQANFLATVAGLHLNVDLVGLQQTGVEYVV